MDAGALRSRFASLHEQGCFVMPNPWDRGSTRVLEDLGFPALATTSAGFSFTRALPDSPEVLGADEVIAHAADLAEVARVPLNVDFQSGYAEDAEGVLRNVSALLATGVAGVSIEDVSGTGELFDLDEATARVRAARSAADAAGAGVTLTARAECFLTGHPDPLAESLRRLAAYAEAGADVLFAPGVREPEDIRAIVDTVAPKPVNVLIGWGTEMSVGDLAELGVRRVSVGSGLARVAWGAVLRAAGSLAQGSFTGLAHAAPFADLNTLFSTGPAEG